VGNTFTGMPPVHCKAGPVGRAENLNNSLRILASATIIMVGYFQRP